MECAARGIDEAASHTVLPRRHHRLVAADSQVSRSFRTAWFRSDDELGFEHAMLPDTYFVWWMSTHSYALIQSDH